ncbi:MAG: Biopolymer transport protein ExbD/TolR [Planctomycetaceae bacterium]|nr:Biopolymer transport protein ExbD/TolR [Planctomycetaceae bacterium]
MSAHSSEGAEPNLTPILDLVFQLITFFMLVINFKGASMDLTLKLPVLGSARPLKWEGKMEPLLLNINREGKVHAYGQSVDVEQHVLREARLLKLQLESIGKPLKNNELPVPVIIRADRGVPFRELNHVIEVCQKQGYIQFSLSAMTSEEVH